MKKITCPCCGQSMTAEEWMEMFDSQFRYYGSREKYFAALTKSYPVKLAQAVEEIYIQTIESIAGIVPNAQMSSREPYARRRKKRAFCD